MVRSSIGALCLASAFRRTMRGNGPDWTSTVGCSAEWRKAADYMLGDYYPLTPYSLAEDGWMAWQFDRPDLGEGMVQAFRRAQSHEDQHDVLSLRARSDDHVRTYEPGHEESTTMLGTRTDGPWVLLRDRATSGSAVILYQAVPEPSSIVLTCIGMIGLLAYAWRKRK